MILEKLLAAIERLTAALEANGGGAPPTEAPKKTRAQKAVEAAQAAPQPEPAPVPSPAPAAAPATQTPVSTVTMEQAISLTKDLAKKSRDAAVATLARHGAAKATELKPEILAAYVADVQAQLNPAPQAGDGLI